MDRAIFDVLGRWVGYFDEALHIPEPTGIEIAGKPDDFILRKGNSYYLFCYNLPMSADPNVALHTDAEHMSKFCLPGKLMSACWLDNGVEVMFQQSGEEVVLQTVPYTYGRSLVVRVTKLTVQDQSALLRLILS
jgi:hypothetical protein